MTFKMEHIISELTIGNTLGINVREKAGTEHSFLSFQSDASLTTVTFDATSLVEGQTFDLILESFDNDGGIFTALMTDTVTVTVAVASCPVT